MVTWGKVVRKMPKSVLLEWPSKVFYILLLEFKNIYGIIKSLKIIRELGKNIMIVFTLFQVVCLSKKNFFFVFQLICFLCQELFFFHNVFFSGFYPPTILNILNDFSIETNLKYLVTYFADVCSTMF